MYVCVYGWELGGLKSKGQDRQFETAGCVGGGVQSLPLFFILCMRVHRVTSESVFSPRLCTSRLGRVKVCVKGVICVFVCSQSG